MSEDHKSGEAVPRSGQASRAGMGNNSLLILAVSVALFAVLVGMAHFSVAKKKSPVNIYTFDKGPEGFKAVGEPEGKLEIDRNPPGLPRGSSAIECTYENQVDHFTGVGSLTVPMSGFSSIKVAVRSKEDRTLGVVVDEIESGAVYVYTFKAKAGTWTEEVCAPDLFLQSSGSSDPNNTLDRDKLNSRLIIADMSGFEGNIGPNVLWISKIEIKTEK